MKPSQRIYEITKEIQAREPDDTNRLEVSIAAISAYLDEKFEEEPSEKKDFVLSKEDQERNFQARRLYEKGFGKEKNFGDYCKDIPVIPASLASDDPDFPLLCLCDPRLGLAETCRLIGIRFGELGYTDEQAIPCDPRHEDPREPFWFRAHDGRRNCNRRPSDCRAEAQPPVFAMTAMVGAMTFLHHPDVVREGEHVMDCSGTLRRGWADSSAYLLVWDGAPGLGLHRIGVAHPRCGSGEFRRE